VPYDHFANAIIQMFYQHISGWPLPSSSCFLSTNFRNLSADIRYLSASIRHLSAIFRRYLSATFRHVSAASGLVSGPFQRNNLHITLPVLLLSATRLRQHYHYRHICPWWPDSQLLNCVDQFALSDTEHRPSLTFALTASTNFFSDSYDNTLT